MASTIRLASPADAPEILSLYAPLVRDTAVSFEVEPPTEEEMGRRIAETLPHLPWLVCRFEGDLLGYAHAGRHRDRAAYQWSAEVSVYVRPDSRRWGVGSGLYTSLLKLLTLQGFHNAYAGITLPNRGSVRLHESLGFRPVGTYLRAGFKLGSWHDVQWWHLPLREGTDPSGSPKGLEESQEVPGWDEALAAGTRLVRP